MDLQRLLRDPPLPEDEERRLAAAARAGDAEARDVLVRASLRLVALRVRAMGFRVHDADDAFQVGVLALMAAIARYDPTRRARLATFAWPWITHALVGLRTPLREVPMDVVPDRPVDEPAEPDARLAELVAGLPEDEREVVAVRFLQDTGAPGPTPWLEVARRLGTSPTTARRRGTRAVSRLRETVATVGDRAPLVGADPP